MKRGVQPGGVAFCLMLLVAVSVSVFAQQTQRYWIILRDRVLRPTCQN